MLAAVDFMTFLPIAVFGAFAAGAWFMIDVLVANRPRAEARLAVLKHTRGRNPEERVTGLTTADHFANVLEKATPAFAKPLQPKTRHEASKLNHKLSVAGFRRESAASIFLGLKLIMLIVGFVMGGGSMVWVYGLSKPALVRTVLASGFMFYLPDIVIWFLGRQRKDAIFLSLPDTLDLLVVCVEAGLGLDQAMRRVADEMAKTYPVICSELNLCNLQLQMGKARNEVLHVLGERTGVDDLRALASILIQADKFGSSVSQALRVQSDSMRTRRRQIAEEKAAKTAVQLIFPLVLFIFPGIFVVLVGPAAITMMREMFPMMNGG